MAKRKRRLATLWEVSDELWERVELLLKRLDPLAGKGRKREDRRRVLDGIIFRMRTGCQWNQISHVYGDDSTIHRCLRNPGHSDRRFRRIAITDSGALRSLIPAIAITRDRAIR